MRKSNCKTYRCPLVVKLLMDMGMSQADVARVTGYPYNTVNKIVTTKYPELMGRRGHTGPDRRFTDEELDAIESEYINGATTYELGKKYHVDHSVISKWMRKRGIRKGKGNVLTVETARTCPRCGKTFTTTYRDKKYCSSTCSRAFWWYKRHDRLRAANHGYEIPLMEVYKRDDGKCYLCGKQTDWNDYRIVNGYKVVGNDYPTRDHVIALANGGTHTWDNVRLACHRCNSAKSDLQLASLRRSTALLLG